MKTLLVLAAGDLQLPAIIVAKQMGLKVVAADADPKAPGMKLADVSCSFDITDAERCLQVAREYGIDGAIQICSEVSMYPLGRINEELGLRGNDSQVAIRATNKEQMRRAFQSRGVPSPRSVAFTSCAEAEAAVEEIGFPVICKPSRNSGSRGITRLTGEEDVSAIGDAFALALRESRDNSALVEEYVEGPEYSVEILVWNGKSHVLAVTDKKTTGPPRYVETGHSQPALLSDDHRNSLVDACVAGVRAIGIDWSAAHAEVRLGPAGPVVIEIGARLGGDFITTELVPRSTGVNMVRAAIQLALGEEPDLTPEHEPKGACIRYFQPSPGRVVEVQGVQRALAMKGVQIVEVSVEPGDEVGEIVSSTARVGHVIAEGENAEQAIVNAEAARNAVRIITANCRDTKE